MVWMTINHLGGPLHAYSFQTLGFISSAEGFVFISGVVAGMVYGRIGLVQGSNPLRKRTFRRAFDIYLYQMTAFIAILFLECIITNTDFQSFFRKMNPLPMESPFTAPGLGALFLWQPAFLDILPMVCLFLLITPFAITLFIKKHGHWWVLGSSALIWSLATYTSWDSLQRSGERLLPSNLGFWVCRQP